MVTPEDARWRLRATVLIALKRERLRKFPNTDEGNMKLLLSILMLLLFCSTPIDAQGTRQRRVYRRPPVLIDKEKPSVYITFARFESMRTGSEKGTQLIWLKLRNNTRWPISIEMSGGRTDDPNEAKLYYQTLDENDEVVADRSCHVCSVNNVGPNQSTTFAVPAADLPMNSRLRIRFSYGWESFENRLLEIEPEHFVYFSAGDIPKTLTPS
ncbi:MAG: hypothetical protein LC113_13295 [Acidobacteria bacterium]|nr:hypothetical protein [Acidobacteriota bacterium]